VKIPNLVKFHFFTVGGNKKNNFNNNKNESTSVTISPVKDNSSSENPHSFLFDEIKINFFRLNLSELFISIEKSFINSANNLDNKFSNNHSTGVFSCGPASLNKECQELTQLRFSAGWRFHKETFLL